MSNEKQETIADIVKEMRQAEETWHRSEIAQLPTQYLKEWSDRIEAAAKREREVGAEAAQICGEIGEMIGREATREKSSQVGNAAKIREALERIRKELIYDSCRRTITKFHDIICEVSYSALSAPPRNCDVGTSEEQDARHSKWCRRYGIDGDIEVACAHKDMSCTLCALRWAQMPYEKGGVNGK